MALFNMSGKRPKTCQTTKEASASAARVAPRGVFVRFAKSFGQDRSGAVAMIFALLTPVVFAILGGALDFGRWIATRDATHRAMDAAVLAAGRAMQVNGTTAEQALAVAEKFFNTNKPERLSFQDVRFELQQNGTVIVSTSDSKIATPFLSVMGIREMDVKGMSKAILAASGNAGTNIEISLMLDTTGSMQGQKMVDLKAAAKDLVDIVVWDAQGSYQSRVALVPFSEHVNVSRQYFQALTNNSPSGSQNKRTCVRERASSTYRYTDEAPGSNRWFNRYPGSGTCRSQNTLIPLTHNKQEVKNAIDALETTGGTAGHLGTVWAWNVLSPNFNTVWPEAQAGLYSDVGRMHEVTVAGNTYEVPVLKKIAVLMTDGEYNMYYTGSNSPTQARETCAAMKAKNIEIYTVGFEIGTSGTAYTTLSMCATSPDHFYNAGDGNALRQAFRDIGLKISTLRLAE